jgi:hypothetical protein
VSARYQPGPRAAHFADSVGVGWYPIDIHRSGPDDVGASCRTKPFQIPLGALLPVRIENLIAGGKNLGTTHITNGCYRLHPVEWNIGEGRRSAGGVRACGIGRRPPRCASIRSRVSSDAFGTRGVPSSGPRGYHEQVSAKESCHDTGTGSRNQPKVLKQAAAGGLLQRRLPARRARDRRRMDPQAARRRPTSWSSAAAR